MQTQSKAGNSGEDAQQFGENTLMHLILAATKWSVRAMINVESKGAVWNCLFYVHKEVID